MDEATNKITQFIFFPYIAKRYFTVVGSNKEWFRASSSGPMNDTGKGPGSGYRWANLYKKDFIIVCTSSPDDTLFVPSFFELNAIIHTKLFWHIRRKTKTYGTIHEKRFRRKCFSLSEISSSFSDQIIDLFYVTISKVKIKWIITYPIFRHLWWTSHRQFPTIQIIIIWNHTYIIFTYFYINEISWNAFFH